MSRDDNRKRLLFILSSQPNLLYAPAGHKEFLKVDQKDFWNSG